MSELLFFERDSTTQLCNSGVQGPNVHTLFAGRCHVLGVAVDLNRLNPILVF